MPDAQTNQTNQPGTQAPAAPPANNQNQAQSKEASWAKIDAVVNAAHQAFTKGSALADVLASLIATFQNMQSEETQNLGGLGTGAGEQGMELPAPPPPEETPEA